MPSTRRFKCTACGHEFEVPFCDGQRGKDMTCPSCGQGLICRTFAGRPCRQGVTGRRKAGWMGGQNAIGRW